MDIDVMHHFALTNFGFADWGPYFALNKAVVWLFLAAGLVVLLFSYVTQNLTIVPGRLQGAVEAFVVYVRDEMCIATIGHGGEKFLPFILSLFLFVFTCNFAGILPLGSLAFTATSNVNVTGMLAVIVFGLGLFLGIKTKGPIGFFTGLVPSGVPKLLWPMLFPIELISLFAKHFALAVRLFANMLAGHIVLLVFAAMAAVMFGSAFTHFTLGNVLMTAASPLPFAMTVIITAFEMFVALLQAFIFSILSALYIGQAIGDH